MEFEFQKGILINGTIISAVWGRLSGTALSVLTLADFTRISELSKSCVFSQWGFHFLSPTQILAQFGNVRSPWNSSGIPCAD